MKSTEEYKMLLQKLSETIVPCNRNLNQIASPLAPFSALCGCTKLAPIGGTHILLTLLHQHTMVQNANEKIAL